MQKRRERIERWRAERKKTEQEATRKDGQKGTSGSNLTVPQAAAKKWSLEDDSEDEEKGNEKSEKEECSVEVEKKEITECEVEKEEVEDDVDPLDEYMKSWLFLIL